MAPPVIFYLTYVERFHMVYQFYSFREYTQTPMGALRPPKAMGNSKCFLVVVQVILLLHIERSKKSQSSPISMKIGLN